MRSPESNNNFESKSLRELEAEKILAETKQQKELLKENISESIINKLNSTEGYIVRQNDILSLVNKITAEGNHITFNDEGDIIKPEDKINIEGKNVYRTHKGQKEIVGVVTKGFKKVETTTKTLEEEKELELGKDDDAITKLVKEGKTVKTNTSTNEILIEENNISKLKERIAQLISKIENEKDKIKFTKISKACNSKGCFKNLSNDITSVLKKEQDKKNTVKQNKNTLKSIPQENKTIPTVIGTYKGNFKTNENTTTITENNLDKEQINLIMSNYPKLLILKDIVTIWKNAAEKEKATEILDMIGLGDKEAIQNGIDKSSEYFNIVWSKIQKLENVTDYQITKVFEPILKTEKEETIVSNMKIVKELLSQVNSSNYSQKRLEILNLMRNGAIQEGSSEKVEEIIRVDILKQKEFENINTLLSNPKTLIHIKNNDTEALKQLGISNEIAEETIEVYGKVKRLQSKNKQIYIDHIKKQEPNINSIELSKKVSFYMSIATNKATTDLLTKLLIFNTFDKDEKLVNKNELNKIYSNMVGVGDYVLSDDNIGIAVETGSMLAISLIPMGVGISASMLAAKVGVGVMRATRLANLAQKGGKLGALGQAITFGTTTALEGVAFYEGYNFTNNILYKEHYSNVFDGAGNGTEIAKSIAFFGILKGFSKVGELSKIKNFTDKIPAGTIKKSATILTEAGLLTGAGFSTEVFAEAMGWNTDIEPELTWEQYIEALIMVGVFRAVGKSPIKTNKGTKLKDSDLKENVEFYKNTKGTTYTKTEAGEFINSKGKILKNEPKNLTKVEVNNSTVKENTDYKITDYEIKRFDSILKKHFKENKNITLINSLGEKIEIKLNSIGKYIINGKETKPLSEKELYKEITHSYREVYLNDLVLKSVSSIGPKEELYLFKDLANPFNGKIQIKEGGEVFLNGKQLSNERKKQLLKIPKVRETILKKELERDKESLILKDLLKTPEFLKTIDAKLSNLPFLLNKPYTFSKWLLYKNKASNFVVNKTFESVKTPYDVISNFKNAKGIKEHSKNILFADKDITWKGGIMKVAGYAVIPTTIEGLITFNNSENGTNLTTEEFIKEVGTDYLSYLYLGVVNSLILEYINNDTI